MGAVYGTEKDKSGFFMAINISVSVRKNTLDLNVGFDEYFEEWEIIIRYTGSLDNIREELNITVWESNIAKIWLP